MNFEFSNSASDLDDDDWPVLSSPPGSLTHFADWLRQKCTEITEHAGPRPRISGASQSGGVRMGKRALLGNGNVASTLFDLDVSFADDVMTVTLHGVLSATACDRLAEPLQRFLDRGGERIVLDLRGLERIELAGIHTLLLAHLRASDELTELLLIPSTPAVQRVLDASGGPFVYVNG
jgi:anti-anti-sigma factor